MCNSTRDKSERNIVIYAIVSLPVSIKIIYSIVLEILMLIVLIKQSQETARHLQETAYLFLEIFTLIILIVKLSNKNVSKSSLHS